MLRNLTCCLLLLGLSIIVPGCRTHYQKSATSAQFYEITSASGLDSAFTAFLNPYKVGVDTQMNVVIGRTDIPLTKAQPECLLGNFMADAQLEAARALDPKVLCSVVNYGGIRLPYIPPGNITRRTMYELMPFDNMLTIIDISGADIKRLCNHMAKARGWPVSGITYTINDTIATDVLLAGKEPNDHIMYKMAISDYLARGGDQCFFLQPLRKRYTSIFLRDAMMNYVASLEASGAPLHPVMEGRVTYQQ